MYTFMALSSVLYEIHGKNNIKITASRISNGVPVTIPLEVMHLGKHTVKSLLGLEGS